MKHDLTPLRREMRTMMRRVNPRHISIAHAELVRMVQVLQKLNWPMPYSPRIVVSHKAQMQPAINVAPNFISICFLQIQDEATFKANMAECIATYAMHMKYLHDKEVHRTALPALKLQKPLLEMPGSATHTYLLGELTK